MNHMAKLFLVSILVLSLIVISCSGEKNTKQSEPLPEKNIIQLNVDVNNPKLTEPITPAVTEVLDPLVQEVSPPSVKNDFFLSGRTDLLSVFTPDFISPEGFSIGKIFAYSTASADEKNIIQSCSSFFESFMTEEMLSFVELENQKEIEDYCEYFLLDNFQFTSYLFGKPVINGNNSYLNMIFYPDFTTAVLYLSQTDSQWLINGFEVDLRVKKSEPTVEKWAPSIKPSLFGNY